MTYKNNVLVLLQTGNRCPELPFLPYSNPSSNISDNGTVITYTCQTGYTFTDSAVVSTSCVNEKWTPVTHECSSRYPQPKELIRMLHSLFEAFAVWKILKPLLQIQE